MSDDKQQLRDGSGPVIASFPDRPSRPPSPGPAVSHDKLAEIADRRGVELLERPVEATFKDGTRWDVWAAWYEGGDLYLLRWDGRVIRFENARVSKVESDPPYGVEETELSVRPFEFNFNLAGREDGGDR